MLQKQTRVGVSDGTGVGWLQVIHIYRGSSRRYAHYGDYVKMSIKSILIYPRYIRGKRYKPLRVGFVVRGLSTNLTAWTRFVDNTRARYFVNNTVLLKKRGVFKSKYILTPLIRSIKKKKYRAVFNVVF